MYGIVKGIKGTVNVELVADILITLNKYRCIVSNWHPKAIPNPALISHLSEISSVMLQ